MVLNYRTLDWKLIAAGLALSLIGILMIMSAQSHAESEYVRSYYLRQLLWLGAALIVFAAVLHLPLRLFDVSAYLMYGVSIALLVLVLLVGEARMGANRWFSFGPVSLAPSDIAKIALVFALARFFAYSKWPPASKRRLTVSAIMAIIPVMLILKQPDLGTSLVFFVILIAMWFWSGLSPWYLLLILSPLVSLVAASHTVAWAAYFVVLLVFLGLLRPGIVFSVLVVIANLASGIVTPIMWNRLAEYQRLRILTFINPDLDPRGAGYQIIQSKIAIGSGGVTGKGLMAGSQSRLEFLPERHTDFIFSVLGEEFGLWGAAVVLVLFGFILLRSVHIATRCRSRFASNVVFGALAILAFQMLVNVGMTLGFMPVTGLPLPFVSYGGTALVMTWTMLALIVSADYRWQEY